MASDASTLRILVSTGMSESRMLVNGIYREYTAAGSRERIGRLIRRQDSSSWTHFEDVNGDERKEDHDIVVAVSARPVYVTRQP